ncbi:PQQ-dependent sugar dehydrogenase [Salinibacillus xinjiangensis]|uniref:Quinoprotein glucose dehydrogenase n=1 Tax=Salinibacillus xinjiangensis TaxID=1229268 RepID=A0A6G1X2K8_9BACI|nr:PQQ-dependent sugar dehydrogenase [Salinibacillus xinjiangensis]MRG85125.1 quinoprotein glucose dehydrogenase [Salinibacillus xinjiangensis]
MKSKVLLLLIIVLVGCKEANEQNKEEATVDKDKPVIQTNGNLSINVVAQNLSIPWTINKHEKIFYLSQRGGTVIRIDKETESIEIQEVDVDKPIAHVGEGGLLGFILAPNFETSNLAFAYHTYEENERLFNRVIVLEMEGNRWVEKDVLLEGIPGGRIHNGGRIKIGPDQKLYVTAGDAGQADLAQNEDSLAGKILRMELDGGIPTDNPFTDSYVYSFGHRNPQGLAWDSNGTLYSTEHGQSAHDEINRVEPGQNYGWPIIEGDQEAPNMETPLYHTGEETWAPSGIAIHDGKLYIATLRGNKLIEFDLATQEQSLLYDEGGRLRDVMVENSTLYTITNNRDGRGTPQEGDDKLIVIPLE